MTPVIIRASSLGRLFDCPASWAATHIDGKRMPSNGKAIGFHIAALDGDPDTRALAESGHAAIRRALGKDIGLLYAEDEPWAA
jgi:hypothetical protein